MTKAKRSGGTGSDGTASGFEPFADDSAAVTIGGFSIENGTNRVSLSGSLDLTKDKAGLAKARDLKAAVDAIVAALEDTGDMPDSAAEGVKPAKTVRNPFE